jgi:hypothetical protein
MLFLCSDNRTIFHEMGKKWMWKKVEILEGILTAFITLIQSGV